MDMRENPQNKEVHPVIVEESYGAGVAILRNPDDHLYIHGDDVPEVVVEMLEKTGWICSLNRESEGVEVISAVRVRLLPRLKKVAKEET